MGRAADVIDATQHLTARPLFVSPTDMRPNASSTVDSARPAPSPAGRFACTGAASAATTTTTITTPISRVRLVVFA